LRGTPAQLVGIVYGQPDEQGRPFITASASTTPIGAAARADPSAGTIAAAHRHLRTPIPAILDLLAPKTRHPDVS
jgi:hypothetical protein